MTLTPKLFKIVLKALIFLACVLFFGIFYLPDIVHQYQTRATTFSTKRVRNDNPTIPAITFCMKKPFKPEVLGKFGRNVFAIPKINATLHNMTLPEFYDQSTFKLSRDFYLYHIDFYGEKTVLGIGRNSMNISNNNIKE